MEKISVDIFSIITERRGNSHTVVKSIEYFCH